jgi:cytochrome c-type biogenesis protein CcmH
LRFAAAGAAILLSALVAFGLGKALSPAAPISAQTAIEQRLMCPQCTQTRLDVCDRPICNDMRSEIRRRLEAGESPDAIVNSFAARYGSDVVAAPPAVLTAAGAVPWFLSALALLGLLAASMRVRPRRPSLPAAP